jgi:hypothetical protein
MISISLCCSLAVSAIHLSVVREGLSSLPLAEIKYLSAVMTLKEFGSDFSRCHDGEPLARQRELFPVS